MTLDLVGTLPVSALNIGLAASPIGLGVEVALLTDDIAKATLSIGANAAVTVSFPPSLALAGLFATFDASVLATAFLPANWITFNADANAELVLDLAFAKLQLATMEPLVADLKVGLGAPGLYGWTYAGNAKGFGASLESETAGGFSGGVLPSGEVNALVIATNSFTSWGSFGNGFRIGTSGDENLGNQTNIERMKFVGSLDGSFWSLGIDGLISGFEIILSGLRGKVSQIEAQIALSLGLNLPNPIPIIEASFAVDVEAALGNMINVSTDLTGEISLLQARIDASLELAGNIAVDLSASGLTFWSYSGPAAGLGSELATELASGLPDAGEGPSGAVYGLVLASADASNWNDFGRVFKT